MLKNIYSDAENTPQRLKYSPSPAGKASLREREIGRDC